jgi:hypothetical protein
MRRPYARVGCFASRVGRWTGSVRLVRQYRALRPIERAIIARLLSVDFRDVEYFRKQIDAITVTSTCSCGCGTIQFAVDPTRAEPAPTVAWQDGPDLLVEGDKQSWLMLFQCDGWLSELEHVAGHGPRPEELDPDTITPDLQVDDDWFG